MAPEIMGQLTRAVVQNHVVCQRKILKPIISLWMFIFLLFLRIDNNIAQKAVIANYCGLMERPRRVTDLGIGRCRGYAAVWVSGISEVAGAMRRIGKASDCPERGYGSDFL